MNSIFYLFFYTNLNLVVIIHIYIMKSVYTHIETEQYYDCYEYIVFHVKMTRQNKTRP